MFLIGLAAALWGYGTSSDCKSLGGIVGRIINQNIRQQCQYTPYAQGAGIGFFICWCHTNDRWSKVKG
jgi:hypothetical protein